MALSLKKLQIFFPNFLRRHRLQFNRGGKIDKITFFDIIIAVRQDYIGAMMASSKEELQQQIMELDKQLRDTPDEDKRKPLYEQRRKLLKEYNDLDR